MYNEQDKPISAELAHARLHISDQRIAEMSEHGSVRGLRVIKNKVGGAKARCKICVQANMKHANVPTERTRTLRPLEIIGCDLQEFETRSHDGMRYLAIYTDHNTGFTATVNLARKNDQEKHALRVIARLERLCDHNRPPNRRFVVSLRADQGGEYVSDQFKQALADRGLGLELSDTKQAFQNGLAEVTGRRIVEMMRAARMQSGVPKSFWSENARHQTWVLNRISMKRQKGRTTPYEEMTGHPADLSRCVTWGCEGWVLIRRHKKEKLSARAERCVHMGASLSKKAWRVLLWRSRKVIESRNVVFFEGEFPFLTDIDSSIRQQDAQERLRIQPTDGAKPADNEEDRQWMCGHGEDRVVATEAHDDDAEDNSGAILHDEDDDQGGVQPESEHEDNDEAEPSGVGDVQGPDSNADQGGDDDICGSALRRSTRVTAQPDRWAPNDAYYAFIGDGVEFAVVNDDPTTDEEALQGPDSQRWRDSDLEEIRSLGENKAYEVVDRPKDAQVLPSMMVRKTKRAHGKVERYKSRFVAKGCADRNKAIKETFAPTLRYATLRFMIALAAMFGVVIHQLDIKTAFLNGVLPYPVFVEQPKSYAVGGHTKVWRLKKALYGLVEAPRLWYEKLTEVLSKIGFARMTGDPCLYAMITKDGAEAHLTVIGVFVDDMPLLGTSEAIVAHVKARLSMEFKTTDLGPASWILGMRIRQQVDVIILDQTQYVRDIISRFNKHIEESRGRHRAPQTPLPVQLTLVSSDSKLGVDKPYREIVGSLAYLANGSYPDLSQPVSQLSRHLHSPGIEHWNAAVHVLRYLEGTLEKDRGIHYIKAKSPVGQFDPESFNDFESRSSWPRAAVDSDFGNNMETGKSTSGQLITIRGAAVSWRSKGQTVVTTSSCHAEYVAACECCREIVWARMMIEEIGFCLRWPSVVLEDNHAAELMTRNDGISDRSKHIQLKWHYVRQCVRDGSIRFARVASKENPADALTKASSKESLAVMLKNAGVKESDLSGSAQGG
jgi:hypothetical protein